MAERGGDRAVGTNGDLVPQQNMADQQRQKIDRRQMKTSWRYGTRGRTSSTMLSAHSMARRCPQLEQRPRTFQKNPSNSSPFFGHSGLLHRKRRNPKLKSPQRVNASKSFLTLE